jgi:uncharacterized DUF497 family protein
MEKRRRKRKRNLKKRNFSLCTSMMTKNDNTPVSRGKTLILMNRKKERKKTVGKKIDRNATILNTHMTYDRIISLNAQQKKI